MNKVRVNQNFLEVQRGVVCSLLDILLDPDVKGSVGGTGSGEVSTKSGEGGVDGSEAVGGIEEGGVNGGGVEGVGTNHAVVLVGVEGVSDLLVPLEDVTGRLDRTNPKHRGIGDVGQTSRSLAKAQRSTKLEQQIRSNPLARARGHRPKGTFLS